MVPSFDFFLCLGFILFSLSLYLAIIIFLIYNRNHNPYNSAFFKLWLALAFTDLLSITNALLVTQALQFGYFRSVIDAIEWGFVLQLHTFVAYSTDISQMAINLLMAINRYMAIASLFEYNLVCFCLVCQNSS